MPLLAQKDSTVTRSTAGPADSVSVMSKSPLGAVLRSAVLPGWGQVYNKSYWKVPVIWGFVGYYTYWWFDRDKMYRKFSGKSAGTNYPGLTSEQLKRNSDIYRDNRDLFAIYIGITYALNLLDAYVDAQLFDFSVEEDHFTQTPRMSVKFHF